jgi:ubiquinone/menaquinone biosynthesis C-methylase UbiE
MLGISGMLNSEKESGPANANLERDYALGYTESEFERLQSQGRFFRDLMEDLLRRAGIASGMHVLDVGCGVGDVSLLAAEVVGPSGGVLGIDRSTEAVNVARIRAVRARQHWVRFY